jgi:tetratricopeptide (TPR) repeat protein
LRDLKTQSGTGASTHQYPSFTSSFFHVRNPSFILPSVKFVSVITLVIFTAHLAHADEAVGQADISAAERAMENDLWDVATSKLQSAATKANLAPDTRARILIMLAESFIRSNQPVKALELLEQPVLENLPETPFWRGQALAGTGRFHDAAESLSTIAAQPNHPFVREAALTTASLYLSLGKPEKSLQILKFLEASPKASDRIEAVFHQIEILIDLKEFDQARSLFKEAKDTPENLLATKKFLDATLTLTEGNAAAAEVMFDDLLAKPEGQTTTRFNLAAIGKADALAARNKQATATQFLLGFILENPDTTALEPMFRRIIAWLPEEIITTDHPTLVQLGEWIPSSLPPTRGLINTDAATAAAAWPTDSDKIGDRAVFAMYARAIGLHRIKNLNAKIEAGLLMQRILFYAPLHFLAPKSLFELAKWHLEANEPEQAFALLESLRQTGKSKIIRGEAAFLDAKIAYEKGEKDLAIALFDEAAALLDEDNQHKALLNAALVRLNENNRESVTIQHEDPAIAKELNIELALEKALLLEDPQKAKLALDAFLTEHPDHPRAIEARITIIEAALAGSPPDLSLARAQIDTIRSSELPLGQDQPARLAIAELRLLDALDQPEKTISLAKQIIEKFPKTPIESESLLILGKSLFRSGNYNEARLVFETIAKLNPGTQRSQASFLLAARSAALGATTQSREEAIALFDQAIAIEGPLGSLAILEKARLNMDLGRINTAIESLSAAYQKISQDDPSRLPTGLLLSEAIYARGDSDPESLLKALEIYNQLVEISANKPAQYFRIQYLRGLTLEKLPDPENPGQTRMSDALAAYYAVLDRPVDPAPPEWNWFERSGFRALTILENSERWEAAISIAEKIASFGGPRAKPASERAGQLRLKQMIWED